MRTIIDLPDVQLDALDAWCERDGISRAEAIRRAIAATMEQQAAQGRQSAYGIWRGRAADGLAWQERLRAEWDAPKTPSRETRPRRRRRA